MAKKFDIHWKDTRQREAVLETTKESSGLDLIGVMSWIGTHPMCHWVVTDVGGRLEDPLMHGFTVHDMS